MVLFLDDDVGDGVDESDERVRTWWTPRSDEEEDISTSFSTTFMWQFGEVLTAQKALNLSLSLSYYYV